MEETIGGAIDIDRAELERRLGLDVPVPVQYARWMGGGRVLHYSKDREEVSEPPSCVRRTARWRWRARYWGWSCG